MKRLIIVTLLLTAATGQALAAGPATLQFKIAEFSTDDGLPSFAAIGLERAPDAAGPEWYIVQFAGAPQPSWLDQIARLGGTVAGDYIPSNACLARMTPPVRAAVERLPQVRFVGFHQPAFRINPDLLVPQIPAKGEAPGRVTLRVVAFDHKMDEALNARLAKIGGVTIEKTGSASTRVSVPADAAVTVAKAIAHDPDVYWVSRQYPPVLHNAWTRWINQSRDSTGMWSGSAWYAKLRIQSADDSLKMPIYARGIYGQNQIVGVDDTGMDWDQAYFRDPAVPKPTFETDRDTICESPSAHRKIVAYNVNDGDRYDLNSSGHGSHTTGSVAGDSLNSNHPASTVLERAMGMAPKARLAFTDIGVTGDGLSLPSTISDIYIWEYNAGARITSSSWGYSAGGPSGYDTDEQDLDRAAWNHKDLLMFRSSGNDNDYGDSANSPATAKNIVCVGAAQAGFGGDMYGGHSWSNPGQTTNTTLRDVAWFSSHGPTKEGMRRPHIIACGSYSIWSVDSDGDTTSNNAGITYMGGTSMSTPAAAGMCALVRQYYTDGFYPSGIAVPANTLTPSGALMKATMIASTRNSPGAYSTSTINSTGTQNVPSEGQGWGAVTLDDALYFDGDARRLEIYDVTPGFTAAGQSDVYSIGTGPATGESFKVVLVWTDYYSALPVTNILVNDLHLEVSDGVNTYRGSVFGTNGYSTTGGTADTKNCEEVVWLPGASAANQGFTITVRSNAINHGPQPYALVIVGDLATNRAPSRPALAKPFDFAGIPSLTPTITFAATDPEADPVSYEVSLDTKADFSTAVTYATATYASGASVDYTFPALAAGTTYWWRVRAQDPAKGSGNFGQASEARSFTIDPAIPTCSWIQRTAGQFGGNTFVQTVLSGDSVIVQASGSGSDTIFSEDFEGAGLPAGWDTVSTVTAGTDVYHWVFGTTGDISTYTPPNYGTQYAYYSDDDNGSGSDTQEDLYSLAIGIPAGTTGLTLEYGYGYRHYSNNDSLAVRVRFKNGGVWGGWVTKQVVKTTSTSGTASYDLTAHLPADSLQILWHYDDGPGAGYEWAVATDNVQVSRNFNLVINDGTMTSLPVAYADFNASFPGSHSDWGYIHLWKHDPADSIGCQVEYLAGGAWAPVPDGDLPGNSSGFFDNTRTIVTRDVTGLSTATYDSIRVVARLFKGSGKASTAPALTRLEVGSTSADPLGVELSSMMAAATDSGIVISWQTASETECYRWEIARSRHENGDYQVVGQVDGHGTTGQLNVYHYTDRAGLTAGTYQYRLTEIDVRGTRTCYGTVSVTVGRGAPAAYSLGRPYPNPSPAGQVTIAFALKAAGPTALKLYNIQGQLVRTLASGDMKAGYYQAPWDGRDSRGRAVSSGVYFYQLDSGGFSATRKLMVLR